MTTKLVTIVNSVVFSPDGQTIASGSRDRTIRLWDTKGNPITQPFRGHQGYVDAVVFSPDGNKIISGSWDSTIRTWLTQPKAWFKLGCDRLKDHSLTNRQQTNFWCKND